MKYKIRVVRGARSEIEALPKRKRRKQCIAAIKALASSPLPAEAERLTRSGIFRLRDGRLKVLYAIDGDILTVLSTTWMPRKRTTVVK